MKRVLILVLCILVAATTAACGKVAPAAPSSATQQTPPATETQAQTSVSSSSSQFSRSKYRYMFRRVNMGDTPEQVTASEAREPDVRGNGYLNFYNISNFEINGDLEYSFREDKSLVRAMFQSVRKQENCVEDYNRVIESITRQYGPPNSSGQYWKNSTSTIPDFNEAVARGLAEYQSQWNTDDIMIWCFLDKEASIRSKDQAIQEICISLIFYQVKTPSATPAIITPPVATQAQAVFGGVTWGDTPDKIIAAAGRQPDRQMGDYLRYMGESAFGLKGGVQYSFQNGKLNKILIQFPETQQYGITNYNSVTDFFCEQYGKPSQFDRVRKNNPDTPADDSKALAAGALYYLSKWEPGGTTLQCTLDNDLNIFTNQKDINIAVVFAPAGLPGQAGLMP